LGEAKQIEVPVMNERSIFAAALDIADPAERAAYLDQACERMPGLRQHLDELIAAQDELGSFLARPVVVPEEVMASQPVREGPGSKIGPYKLLQQIGEGGMGIVYMAEQEQPVRRKVALKIIKPGMDSQQVIARFEAERQALAMMDHLHIAKVFDAGTTDSGLPYFVMELVYGVPITKFCDDHQLTPWERLELFIPVCQAIQHAHQKGVIHRDVKPGNVLVTMYDDKPVPKVIDFGVAKATEQPLTEKTMFTHFGALVGTFEYMSPEQAEMNALGVDTRSDVYSLGVLLYELLTGTTPLERKQLREAALDELLRRIKEEEPPRPSVRLTHAGDLPKIAAARRMEPARLSKLVNGEIDWIVMKCLEKDRSRRYESASALARDVERYLRDEPVDACPPSAAYRLRKYARRHRAAFATAAGFIGLLLVCTGVSAWLAIRAMRAERDAAKALDEALAARNAVSVYQELLLRDPKLRMLPLDHPDRAFSLAQLGRLLLQFGQPAEAEPFLRQCLAIRDKRMPDSFLAFNARSMLGEALLRQEKFAEAEPLLLQGYEGLKQREATTPSTSFVHPADVVENLVQLYEAWDKPDQAAKWRKKLEEQRKSRSRRTGGDRIWDLRFGS
jgi:eukaryotic-like serine/threonine-protein kinase